MTVSLLAPLSHLPGVHAEPIVVPSGPRGPSGQPCFVRGNQKTFPVAGLARAPRDHGGVSAMVDTI
jgi:hypothetical protein